MTEIRGHRADIIIIDDPYIAPKPYSEHVRAYILNWFTDRIGGQIIKKES